MSGHNLFGFSKAGPSVAGHPVGMISTISHPPNIGYGLNSQSVAGIGTTGSVSPSLLSELMAFVNREAATRPSLLWADVQVPIDKIQKNDVQKNIQVVVKNASFKLLLRVDPDIESQLPVHLNKFTYNIMLIYDTEGGVKPVDFIKSKPVKFEIQSPSSGDHSNTLTFSVRISVLSSQHEDLCFCLKINALNPFTAQEIHPALSAVSNPIKVISKPEPANKRSSSQSKAINQTMIETVNEITLLQKEVKRLSLTIQERLKETLGSVTPNILHSQSTAPLANRIYSPGPSLSLNSTSPFPFGPSLHNAINSSGSSSFSHSSHLLSSNVVSGSSSSWSSSFSASSPFPGGSSSSSSSHWSAAGSIFPASDSRMLNSDGRTLSDHSPAWMSSSQSNGALGNAPTQDQETSLSNESSRIFQEMLPDFPIYDDQYFLSCINDFLDLYSTMTVEEARGRIHVYAENCNQLELEYLRIFTSYLKRLRSGGSNVRCTNPQCPSFNS